MEQKTEQPKTSNAALVRKLDSQYRESKSFHAPTERKRKEWLAIYNNEQWDDQQKLELEEQGRPPMVLNKVFKAINNLAGRQRDSRLNFKAHPLGADDVLKAALCTRGLGHIWDANKAKFTESEAFKDALIIGPVFAEVGYDESDPTKEPIFFRYVRDKMLYDPHGRNKDLSDFRYLIREKEVDFDVALEHLGAEHEQALREAVVERKRELNGTGWGDYGNRDDGRPHGVISGEVLNDFERERVLLREHQYWSLEDFQYVDMPNGDRIDWDPEDPAMALYLQDGGQLKKGKRRCYYTALMAGSKLLSNEKDDLPFARFRYVALWAFVDHENRGYGIVEPMVWAQKGKNVALSRLNQSIRSRWVIYEGNALGATKEDDIARKLGQSNFVLKVDKLAQVQIGSDKTDVPAWMQAIQMYDAEIDDIIGLNEAAYGDKSNEKSGKAIQARVQQQSQNLGELFDNWRFFRLQVGEMMLALALKYWSKEKWARIGEASLLQEHQEAAQMAMMRGTQMPPQADLSWIQQAVSGINSMLRLDIKLEDQAETTTERQATMEQAIQLAGLLPDVAKGAIAPDIIRMSDFEGKEEMANKAEQALAPPPMAPPGAPPGMAGPPMLPDPNQIPPPAEVPMDPAGFSLPPDPGLVA